MAVTGDRPLIEGLTAGVEIPYGQPTRQVDEQLAAVDGFRPVIAAARIR